IDRPGTLPSRPGGGTGGGAITRPGDGGAIYRPGTGIGDRPGISGGVGDRPGIGDRPGGIADRPSQLPNRPDRPGIVDRPSIADRPVAGNRRGVERPPINAGDRVIAGSGNNGNVNRWAAYSNRGAIGTHPVWSRPAYWNKRWYANRPAWYWGRP